MTVTPVILSVGYLSPGEVFYCLRLFLALVYGCLSHTLTLSAFYSVGIVFSAWLEVKWHICQRRVNRYQLTKHSLHHRWQSVKKLLFFVLKIYLPCLLALHSSFLLSSSPPSSSLTISFQLTFFFFLHLDCLLFFFFRCMTASVLSLSSSIVFSL